jgi:hypothetical protein
MSINSPAPGTPQTPHKAILAWVMSFIGALLMLVQDKTEFGDLTPLQWIIALLMSAAVAGGVYVIPNRAKGRRV